MINPPFKALNDASLQDLVVLYKLICELNTTTLKLRNSFAKGCVEIYHDGTSSIGEISKAVGVSRQRISQILSVAGIINEEDF